MNHSYDLAIVGGGIIGAWTAWLSKERWPARRVVLLERSLVGHGTTLYSPGHNHPYGLTKHQRDLSRKSLEYYRLFRSRFPDVPFVDISLLGVVSEENVSVITERYVQQDFFLVDDSESEQIRAKFGLAVPTGHRIHAGVRSSYSVPTLVVRALISDTEEAAGYEVWQGADVEDVTGNSECLVLSLADGRTVCARSVVVTPGPLMLHGPVAGLAEKRKIRLKKIVAMHIASRPSPANPIIYLHEEDSYLMPRPDLGYSIFSFPSPNWDVRPEPTVLQIDSRDREVALEVLSKHFPSLVGQCHGGRFCCDAYSAEEEPLVWRSPDTPSLIVAGAGSGQGFRLAPAIAEQALALVE